MRRLLLILLPLTIIGFYAGVAGAAAMPYYGAVSDFFHTAASRLPSVGTSATPTARPSGHDNGGHGATPTAVAVPTKTHPLHKQLSQQILAKAVQRLAKSSPLPRRRINFLILGSDNDQKFASYNAPLTQVMIVLSVDPVSHTITLLSIPRDFYVHIPGYQYNVGPDGRTGWSKIDVASKLGFDSAACTVERDFGIPIDHWVWVGLKGFIKVIDTINGVTLDVTHPVIDDNYPDDLGGNPYAYRRIYIPPGPQHLYGDSALHFVRSRHGDIQGDFGRSSRQQILLTQIRRKIEQQDAAGLVALMPALLQDFHNEIKTDSGLQPSLSTVSTYWGLLHAMSHDTITNVVLSPPTYSTPEYYVWDNDPQVDASNGGQPIQEDAVAPNWTTIDPLIVQLFGGQDTTGPHCALVPGAGQ